MMNKYTKYIREVLAKHGIETFATYSDKRADGRRYKFCLVLNGDDPKRKALLERVVGKLEFRLPKIGLTTSHKLSIGKGLNVAVGQYYWCLIMRTTD